MTNDADKPDEVFEQMARKAGAALRRSAPSDGIERLRSARRRRQVLRSSIAVGTSAIVVVIGLVALTRPSDRSDAPSGSPNPSATATSDTTASTTTGPSTTTTAPAPPPLSLTYTLSGVDGLAPVGDQQVTDISGYTSLIAAWSTVAGVTDGYLVLYETQAPESTAPEGDMTSVSIEVPDGHAYLVTDNGFETLTSATRVMWWRGDGRLWVVSNWGLAPERLTELALAIQPGSGLPYVLPDPAMTFIGFNTAESYESVSQDWMLDGSHLILAATTGGLAQQLSDETPVSIVERTIAGTRGYAVTLANGQVNLTWPTDNADHWGSLIIAAPLVGRVDEIAAAITPV